MFEDKKHKVLFKCQDCGMIISASIENEEDLDQIKNDKFFLTCPCEGISAPLRD